MPDRVLSLSDHTKDKLIVLTRLADNDDEFGMELSCYKSADLVLSASWFGWYDESAARKLAKVLLNCHSWALRRIEIPCYLVLHAGPRAEVRIGTEFGCVVVGTAREETETIFVRCEVLDPSCREGDPSVLHMRAFVLECSLEDAVTAGQGLLQLLNRG